MPFISENELERALVKAAKNPQQAPDFYRLLLESDLLVMGTAEGRESATETFTVTPGSRFNLVIVVRIGSDGLSEETRERSADGVVAYSCVCTHQACPVNMWVAELPAFVCSCHGSEYDPKNGAEVLAGPAPRPLPALPLKSENGLLTVAGGFTGRVGGETN